MWHLIFIRRDCDSTAQYLSSSGIQAAAYHAGLTDKQRSHVHESWLKNRFKVMLVLRNNINPLVADFHILKGHTYAENCRLV